MNPVTAEIESLWHAHHTPILKYVRFKTRSQDYEDMTQTIFLRAFLALKTGKGPKENEEAWLWRIARNLVFDYYRWGHLREHLELDANYGLEQDGAMEAELRTLPEPEPEELVMQRMEQERVRAAIEQLSAIERDTVTLRLEGYAFGEIANILGVAEITAKQRSTRAKKNLREYLQEVT